MTNPGNAIGTNGAFGGRTSVNAFNDDLALYVSRGILSGFAVSPDSGMKIVVGGDGTTRDVAIAEDNIGNKTTINNISGSPVQLTISGAPASNSRIDAIVAYVDNPAQGSATQTDNFGACGLIVVEGTVAGTPSKPNESDIRSAITTDGASGTTAYFVVLGYVSVANGTTDITSNMIEQGGMAGINTDQIENGSITNDKIANDTLTPSKVDWTQLPERYSNDAPATTTTISADTNNINANLDITMTTHGGDIIVEISVVSYLSQNRQYSFPLYVDGVSKGGIFSRNNNTALSNYGFRRYTGIPAGQHTFSIGAWVNSAVITLPAYSSQQVAIREIPPTK